MPAIVSFEDAFIAGLRRLEISQVDVLWLRLDCFRVDRGHHVYAGHLRGCRVHDGRALARLNLLHLGDASVQSRLRNADLGVVEGARFRIPKQFLLARGVNIEVEAGHAWHRRHALGRLVDHLEARIVQRVGVVFVLARHLVVEISRVVKVETRLHNLSEVGLDAEARLVFVFHHVVGFTFKDCLVVVASTLPIFDEQFFDAR